MRSESHYELLRDRSHTARRFVCAAIGERRVLPRNLLSAEGAAPSGRQSAVHPEDVEQLVDKRGVSVANGER